MPPSVMIVVTANHAVSQVKHGPGCKANASFDPREFVVTFENTLWEIHRQCHYGIFLHNDLANQRIQTNIAFA